MADKTMAGTRTGTPGFVAPEVFHNEPYGKSVDIYSLGMVLYWMLNYRTLPFLPLPPQMPTIDDEQDALQRRMRGEALPRPANGSHALQDVVLKACAYRPEDRYATPDAFLRALEAVRAADTSAADTVSDVRPVIEQRSDDADADATMGNNWETGAQTEAQPELTDLDATEATMETIGADGSTKSKEKAAGEDHGARNDFLARARVQPAQAEKARPANAVHTQDFDFGSVPSTSAATPGLSSGKSEVELVRRYACIAPENRKIYILQDALVLFLGLMFLGCAWFVFGNRDLQPIRRDFGWGIIEMVNYPFDALFDICLFGYDDTILIPAGIAVALFYALVIVAAVFAFVDLRRHLAARKYAAQHGAVKYASVQQAFLFRFNRYEEKKIFSKKEGSLTYVIVLALLLLVNLSLPFLYKIFVPFWALMMWLKILSFDVLFIICVFRYRVRKNARETYRRL